jgi:peptidoglycan/xylan/chitin deacetylase (PgdA/CDA1 family)
MQLLPNQPRTDFLNRVFPKYVGDEESIAKTLYLDAGEIREMAEYGMIIGSHTHTHNRLDSMDKKKSLEELRISKSILQEITGKTIDCVSYPYGNYNKEMIAILSQLGYAIGLGTEIGINDKDADPLFLKRFDEKYLYDPPISLPI